MDKESQFARWFNKIMAQPYGEGSCTRFSNICLTGKIEFGKDNQKFFHDTICPATTATLINVYDFRSVIQPTMKKHVRQCPKYHMSFQTGIEMILVSNASKFLNHCLIPVKLGFLKHRLC